MVPTFIDYRFAINKFLYGEGSNMCILNFNAIDIKTMKKVHLKIFQENQKKAFEKEKEIWRIIKEKEDNVGRSRLVQILESGENQEENVFVYD